ncbi:hypothetical protein PSH77_04130 [Pseudomonas extremorientalis]|uniref:hypothetical protein n=1 Tax=Pseudomonas extremorientalis TaxID=169669 RepID=UPI002733E3BA|nr:hypothetical protein [Pseudomonas extremorientalis]WLG57710.1 hypothetical protein PSH77_04130 [Pseudomonas extremorientalis]
MAVIEQIIQEDRLTFHFPANAMASKYDEWTHYRRQFNGAFGGTKAVDILYIENSIGWLIEIKDYRIECKISAADLADVVALKVRDTLAGLVSANMHAYDQEERRVARKLLGCRKLRVVLHIEQPEKKSKLRPQAIDPAAVLQKLKGQVRAIDPHPSVVSQNNLKAIMQWRVEG